MNKELHMTKDIKENDLNKTDNPRNRKVRW